MTRLSHRTTGRSNYNTGQYGDQIPTQDDMMIRLPHKTACDQIKSLWGSNDGRRISGPEPVLVSPAETNGMMH